MLGQSSWFAMKTRTPSKNQEDYKAARGHMGVTSTECALFAALLAVIAVGVMVALHSGQPGIALMTSLPH